MTTPYIVERQGKQYMYRATSHYSSEKRGPVAETEYMGVVIDGKLKPKRGYFYNESTGEFGPIKTLPVQDKVPMRLVNKRYGDTYFLMALQKRLHILDDLEAAFGRRNGSMIMAVVFAYTIQPSALMHLESVVERRYIPEMLQLPSDIDLSSPRLSELTHSIGTAHDCMDEFFRRRISSSDEELIFDLTSESTYSLKNTDAEWGRNKDRVPLRQINVGLVTDRHGRPLMFRTYPGSVADVTTLGRIVDDVRRLGGKDNTLVMDRGFMSPRIIMYLLENGMDFVMPMVVGDKPIMRTMVTDLISKIGNVENLKVYSDRSYTVDIRQMGIRRCKGTDVSKRNTIWEDPDGYDLLLDDDPEFGSCNHLLDVFLFRDVESAGSEIAGMDIALNGIINDIEGKRARNPKMFFSKVAGMYESMLEMTVDEKGMHASIRQNAHTFAANRKGVFVMIAPASDERGWDDVLRCYECRDNIEDAIFQDKSEGDGRTPRSGDRDTIVGRTFIRMVSLILRMEMINRISEVANDKTMKKELKPRDIGKRSPTSLLDSLSNIELIIGDGWNHLTEVTKDCRLIYNMFNIGPPKGIDRF